MATDVAAGLPNVILQPGSTITVTLDTAGAKVTRLSVHGWQASADGTSPGTYLPTGPLLVPSEV